ncbi:hypothetical protein SVAN01_07577 [Stagonosporopsis vannaccii]|nr:hypothetical protein SVAN01_07577 [Stagonosporopsis vannaccii]
MERLRLFTWPKGVEESVLRQKKVTCTIPVQAEFRRTTHRREADTFVNSVYSETGCIVVALWDRQTIKRFDVFAGAGSQNAVNAINKWIARGDERSKDASAWAKTPAFNHTQWYQDQLEREEAERMEFFLGPLPNEQEGLPMRESIIVDWPEDLAEDDITPRTAFGNELEALNDIRKQDGVFIMLLSNHRMEILGFNAINIDAAKSHYETMIQRIRADKCINKATNIVMDEREGIDIVLLRAGNWWPNLTDMVVPRLLSSGMMDQPGRFREDGIDEKQLTNIVYSFRRALEAVSYRKGSYDFAVRLGCIALSSKQTGEAYVGRKHGKDLFIKSIKGKVDLSPKKWLLDNMFGSQLYDRLVANDEVLEPTKAAGYWGAIPDSLENTRPSLRGAWIFKDPNTKTQFVPHTNNGTRPIPVQESPPTAAESAQNSLFVVQIDWTDDGEGSYDKTETRFYRLGPGESGPKANMDINLLELGESRAWSFALESMTLVPKSTVPPVLAGFAQRTVLKQGLDISLTQSFAAWDTSPSVKNLLLQSRLDKVYSFGVRNTCYKVELAAMWYSGQSSPCWGLAVRHTEWAIHLAELERLQTGHQATWGDILETFLPADGGSSSKPKDDDLGVGNLILDDNVEKLPRQAPFHVHGGVQILTNILLHISGIVSSVTAGCGVQI